jgi:miniconductance mechanosensitive channel
MTDFFTAWFIRNGLQDSMAQLASLTITIIIIVLIALLVSWVAKRYLVNMLEEISRRSKNKIDDIFVNRDFIRRLTMVIPVLFIYLSADLLLPPQGSAAELTRRASLCLFVIVALRVIDALILSIRDIYEQSETSRRRPIRGYTDAAKILSYVMGGIFIISIVTDKSPWGILSILGGFTVILMLIFKDTILGFVASIQLSSHDMVRIGDWLEMPQQGADGDVIDVSIHTVKVQNWDKTITTIPTYKLVSDNFKNWRGMSESGGRRIKRSLFIDINSITFCTDEMLERFSRFHMIEEYIKQKQDEISRYNQEHNVDTSQLINGRRQTNIGVFRAYIIAYLKQHPKIHQDMTFLVRHLAPTEHGLPVQIYVFSNDQKWANYEAIQADIFDHLLAAAPEFDLRLFQNPSGYDFRKMAVS